MKLVIWSAMEKRPFRSALMAIFTVGIISLGIVNINLLAAHSQLGGVVISLVRLSFKLIPPALWLGGGLLVTLWLVVLHRAWRN